MGDRSARTEFLTVRAYSTDADGADEVGVSSSAGSANGESLTEEWAQDALDGDKSGLGFAHGYRGGSVSGPMSGPIIAAENFLMISFSSA
jgi:hypothetical protein